MSHRVCKFCGNKEGISSFKQCSNCIADETLLKHLVPPPILDYPDFSKPFVLHTDASQEGLGAVLYQKQDGKMEVIGYGSRSPTKAEKNYFLHSGKLEFLVLKWAI